MGKTALILGATGLVGGACLARLLKDDSFERVVAITRTPLAVKHDKLFNAVVDFNHPASFLEYCVGDVLFSAMGTTIGKAGSKEAFFKVDYTYPYEVAKAAKQNGVATHVLVSSLGADAGSAIFYSQVKGKLEQDIASLDFTTNIILQPSILLGERKESRPMERLGQGFVQKCSFLFVGPLAQYKGVKAETVAIAMIELAKGNYKGKLVVENQELFTFEQ
ncbi:MAG: NAD(P)H-binding protein [Chitinophagales bacterium]|nr:NAD(P)H-binding protein [Chitinophagales bacterium]